MAKHANKLPHQKRPCSSCPFRKTALSLRMLNDRMAEIIANDTHTCHVTQDSDRALQCAGHMLLKGDDNRFVQFANRLGFSLDISGRELVFDTLEEALMHHSSAMTNLQD